MPPGGPDDLRPPVVVSTEPRALETVTDLQTEIRFDFDERISERVSGGALETAVTVSPTLGEYEVQHGRQSLTVKLDGGLREGLVYRVTLAPAVSDMFGNTITDPFELIFSTGGEPVPTTLAGEVWDRITGRPVADAALVAIDVDSLVHRSTADRGGIFAFRYLPGGTFEVTAFEDQNRNGEPDSTEVQGVLPLTIAAGDTVLLEIPILTPDTSAANVTGADAIDSSTVAILFDDFLDYESGVDGIGVTIESDSLVAPMLLELMHETAYVDWVEMVTDSLARLDSIEAEDRVPVAALEAGRTATDSVESEILLEAATPDSTGTGDALTPSDTVVVTQMGADSPGEQSAASGQREPPPSLPPLEGSTAGPTSDGRRVLPGRRLVARMDGPIPYDAAFTVTVSGVVNIFGLPGGGGEATLVREVVVDSADILDSIARGDSVRMGGTGAVAAPDTGWALRSPGPHR